MLAAMRIAWEERAMSIRESRFGRLVEHFFAGFLDNDLLSSSEAGMHATLTQIIALVAAPGCIYSLFLIRRYAVFGYRESVGTTWPDKVVLLSFAMIFTGLLSVIEWDALFPDRRDYQLLVPLPITTRLLFASKLSSVLVLFLIFWAAANVGPALLLPLITVASANSAFELARNAAAHLITTFAACS